VQFVYHGIGERQQHGKDRRPQLQPAQAAMEGTQAEHPEQAVGRSMRQLVPDQSGDRQ